MEASTCNYDIATVQKADIHWNKKEISTFLLFYYNHIQTFCGSCQETINSKWEELIEILSKSSTECEDVFAKLHQTYFYYLQLRNSNPNIDVLWPYFDILTKINGFTLQPDTSTAPEIDSNLLNVDPVNISILEYYVSHKRLFKMAQFGGEIRLWSILGARIGLTPENIAYRWRVMRVFHKNLRGENHNTRPRPNNLIKTYIWLSREAFDESRVKITNKLKKKWNTSDDILLIKSYKELKGRGVEEVWSEIGAKMGYEEYICRSKFEEYKCRYLRVRQQKILDPERVVTWSLYPLLNEALADEGSIVIREKAQHHLDEENGITNKKAQNIEAQFFKTNVEDGKETEGNNDKTICFDVAPRGVDASIKYNRQTWMRKNTKALVKAFATYFKDHKRKYTNEKDVWIDIGCELDIKAEACEKRFKYLMRRHDIFFRKINSGEETKWKLYKVVNISDLNKVRPIYKVILDDAKEPIQANLDIEKINNKKLLQYYLDNIQEFLSPKYKKAVVWDNARKSLKIECDVLKKFTSLRSSYEICKKLGNRNSIYYDMFAKIEEKEKEILEEIKKDPLTQEEVLLGYGRWSVNEVTTLVGLYHRLKDKFLDPKYHNAYIWREIGRELGMNSARVRHKLDELLIKYEKCLRDYLAGDTMAANWQYFDLMKIYFSTDLSNPLLCTRRVFL